MDRMDRDGEGSLAVLLLAERARKECAHMGQGRVLARPRRTGEKVTRNGRPSSPPSKGKLKRAMVVSPTLSVGKSLYVAQSGNSRILGFLGTILLG
jgi:hypothetical protein